MTRRHGACGMPAGELFTSVGVSFTMTEVVTAERRVKPTLPTLPGRDAGDPASVSSRQIYPHPGHVA